MRDKFLKGEMSKILDQMLNLEVDILQQKIGRVFVDMAVSKPNKSQETIEMLWDLYIAFSHVCDDRKKIRNDN